MDVTGILKEVKSMPPNTIILLGGLFCLLLPCFSKIGGITVDPKQKRYSTFIGLVLLTIGLTPYLTPTFLSSSQLCEPSPTQFMKDYYKTINQKEIDKAWEMLTPKFQKEGSHRDREEYYEWWKNRVDQVKVQREPELLDQTNNTATVKVQIAYVRGKKETKEKPQKITLICYTETKFWQIDDSEKL